ncbi:hypothetical protein KJ966_09180 [bacterium]|nr:hypothetical protein [bacterium]
MDLSMVIRSHIQKALKYCDGRVEGKHGAARLLTLNPSTLRTRMKKLGIPFGRKTEFQVFAPCRISFRILSPYLLLSGAMFFWKNDTLVLLTGNTYRNRFSESN